MHAVAGDELAEVHAKLVVGVGGNVVKLVHRDQSVVEGLDPEPVHREPEGGMRADEHLVRALQEGFDRVDLAAVVGAGGVAEVPSRLDAPVRPEAEVAQRLVVKAGPDCLLRHDDDCLSEPLIVELVEGDEHERPALARGRRRLDKKVLFAPLLIGALLHRPHAEGIGLGRAAVARVSH